MSSSLILDASLGSNPRPARYITFSELSFASCFNSCLFLDLMLEYLHFLASNPTGDGAVNRKRKCSNKKEGNETVWLGYHSVSKILDNVCCDYSFTIPV